MLSYDRLVKRILQQLRQTLDGEGEALTTGVLEQRMEQAAHRIAQDVYYATSEFPPVEALHSRMRHLEVQYEALAVQVAAGTASVIGELNKQFDRSTISCRFREENMSAGIAQFIVSGGPSPEAIEQGRIEADENLSMWLKDAAEVTILDPYLFKREKPRSDEIETDVEREKAECRHADELLTLVGRNKRVNFIYRGNPDKGEGGPHKVTQGVANRISDRLEETGLQSTFFVVEDLHDRVWMKRDGKNRWHAKVIGTSRGGIGKRPTYIIDMHAKDCERYLKFVKSLMARAQTSHERPIDFKKPRPKRVSNSGRTQVMSGPRDSAR